MQKSDPEHPNLTKNEKEVLKRIINQAKVSDSDIAKSLRLTQQAVFKIRHKLENLGLIEGYMPIINFAKLGINVMVIIAIRVLAKVWERSHEDEVSERIKGIPFVINAYRIPESDITHILLMGFRDTNDKDKQIMKLQTKYSDQIEIKHIYPFSVNRVISQNPLGLLFQIIDEKEFILDKLFL